jgi:hypothetical protein
MEDGCDDMKEKPKNDEHQYEPKDKQRPSEKGTGGKT